MSARRTLFAALAAAAVAQTALLIKIVYDRHTLIKTGREIVVPVLPVDPRDFLRGDYVILGYTFGQMIRSSIPGGDSIARLDREDPVYVTLHPDGQKGWMPVGLSPVYPSTVAAGETVLKGRINYNYNDTVVAGVTNGQTAQRTNSNLSVRYGIESYFVPEGTGMAIEDNVRDKKVEAIVAVGQDGTAALKGLIVGGERHDDPPIL